MMEQARQAHPGLADITWENELIGGPAAKAIADVANVRGADEIISARAASAACGRCLGALPTRSSTWPRARSPSSPSRWSANDAAAQPAESAGAPA
jgi:hypothetical protein